MHIDSFNVLSKTSEESNRYMKVGAIEQQYSAQLQSDSTLKTHYNNLKRIDRLFLTRYQTLRFTSKLPPPPPPMCRNCRLALQNLISVFPPLRLLKCNHNRSQEIQPL